MNRSSYLVIDLGFGDQGKGTIVDALVRKTNAHTVVRFNGGPQAAHHVVTPEGREHTFQQFGSGTFVPGVQTFLSRYVFVSPWAMVYEAKHLASVGVQDPWKRLFVDERAVVVTPFHRAVNQLRELARGEARHGSCGVGFGEAVSDSLRSSDQWIVRAGDFRDRALVREKLERVRCRQRDEAKELIAFARSHPSAIEEIRDLEDEQSVDLWLSLLEPFFANIQIVGAHFVRELFERSGSIVFEGAQGVLLDEARGFDPYTTWSRCSDHNARQLLREVEYQGTVTAIGVLRGYSTRHGVGPFPTEDARLTALLPDQQNALHPWQGAFRVGLFDAVLARYAIACCEQIDGLAITCLDRMASLLTWQMSSAYEENGRLVRDLPLGPYGGLSYQRSLTERLFKVRPHVVSTTHATTQARRVREHLEHIQNELDREVVMISQGPTAQEKTFFSTLE